MAEIFESLPPMWEIHIKLLTSVLPWLRQTSRMNQQMAPPSVFLSPNLKQNNNNEDLFIWENHRKKETEISSIHKFTPLNVPNSRNEPVKARSQEFLSVSHMSTGPQVFESFSVAFPGKLAGGWIRSRMPELAQASIW